MVLDPAGQLPCAGLEEAWRFKRNEPGLPVDREILEVWLDAEDRVNVRWVPVRPLPQDEGWFEQVWREYRDGNVIA